MTWDSDSGSGPRFCTQKGTSFYSLGSFSPISKFCFLGNSLDFTSKFKIYKGVGVPVNMHAVIYYMHFVRYSYSFIMCGVWCQLVRPQNNGK